MNNNEPIVLGKIKKGKTGKPLVVLIIFLFAGALILFLPTISNYFGDYNIIDLIKNGQVIDFFINNDKYQNKKEEVTTENINLNESKLINNKTILEYNNFTLSNINLTTKDITFTINTKNNINFDKLNYYLILEKDGKEINIIRLVGEVKGSQIYSFNFIEELNDIVEVKGNIKSIREKDYPKFTLSSDETGSSSLFCIKENTTYEYIFNNNLLIKIKEIYKYQDNGNYEEYFKYFEEYSILSNKINNNGGISTVNETFTGFTYNAEIDLNTYQINLNNNYYSLNTKSNKVNFEMKAKGYDCK